MKRFERLNVIYTGSSASNLRSRIGHDHFKGNSAFSTFRISLGCLMGFRLVPRDRIPDGKHFRFAPGDEKALSEWMRENLVVYYRPSPSFDLLERVLIGVLNPPLNLQKNSSPVNADFRYHLKGLRGNH